MKQVMVVTKRKDDFLAFTERLEKEDFSILWAETGEGALSTIKDNNDVFMVIVDETLSDMAGVTFIEKLLYINAMIYTALVSTLSKDDYHELSEGFGVLMQLPVNPDKENAEKLYLQLKKISAL